MSSFSGQMKEYCGLSIDRFDGVNLLSTAYFLSHKHSDHMHGMMADTFAYRLASNNHIKLYCSPITKSLLLHDSRYRHLQRSIVAKEVDDPWVLEVPEQASCKIDYKITVTLLPAQHCPGSVMFLFEGEEGTVLYTGDFRLSRSDITSMTNLHSGLRPKHIKSMYVDTTFCVPQAHYIPSRDESVEAVVSLIENWLNRGPAFYVCLRYKASIGYEQLLVEISRHFNMLIHVSSSTYRMYQKIANLVDYTTDDPALTRIHACKCERRRAGVNSCLPCGYRPSSPRTVEVRYIGVATMCFIERVAKNKFLKMWSDSSCKVCYSFHSSYSEIRDIIQYLKPSRAFPNVIAMGQTFQQMQKRLDSFVEMSHTYINIGASQEPRKLGKIMKKAVEKKRQISVTDSEDYDFGEKGYTPEKKKQKLTSPSNSIDFPALFGPVPKEESCDGYTDGYKDGGYEDDGYEKSDEESVRSSQQDMFDDEQWSMPVEDEEVMKNFTPPDEVTCIYGDKCSFVGEDYAEDEAEPGDECHYNDITIQKAEGETMQAGDNELNNGTALTSDIHHTEKIGREDVNCRSQSNYSLTCENVDLKDPNISEATGVQPSDQATQKLSQDAPSFTNTAENGVNTLETPPDVVANNQSSSTCCVTPSKRIILLDSSDSLDDSERTQDYDLSQASKLSQTSSATECSPSIISGKYNRVTNTSSYIYGDPNLCSASAAADIDLTEDSDVSDSSNSVGESDDDDAVSLISSGSADSVCLLHNYSPKKPLINRKKENDCQASDERMHVQYTGGKTVVQTSRRKLFDSSETELPGKVQTFLSQDEEDISEESGNENGSDSDIEEIFLVDSQRT